MCAERMRVVTLSSSSSGNCTLVSGEGGNLLIDAGISMRRIGAALACFGLRFEDLSGILVTHEHSDHVSALPMLGKYHQLPVFAPGTVAAHLRAMPGIDNAVYSIPVGEDFSLAGMNIVAFHTPHDTEESVGYRVEDGCVFALATDMGHVTEEVESHLLGADAVVIESNHDVAMLNGGAYPPYLKRRILSPRGHLSNDDCARLAVRLADSGTRYIILGHLSRENNRPSLAYDTVKAALEQREVFLCTAPASESMELVVERSGACSM